MKKLIITCLCALIGLCVHSQTQYINPFIGTQGMGHTFPGACVPPAGVQLSPETDTIPHSVDGVYQKEVYKYCAGYQYDDTTIVGFSHTHFSGTGHSDLGDILLMPTTGKIQLNPGTKSNPTLGYRSTFRHENETASPGYYSVLLDEYQVKAELTTTERVGVHRYTYPKGEGNLILDLNHGIYNYDGKTLWSGICVESDTLVTGFRMTNGWARMNLIYFAISFSHPILRYESKDTSKRSLYGGFWRKFDVQHNFPEMEGRELKAGFVFDLSDGRSLEIKVAISAVDKEGALLNLKKETQGKNFDKVLAEAKSKWNKAVSSISVNGTEEVKELFYTSLYRTLIHPSVYMDVDGRYRGIDHSIHNAEHFTNYTIFSLWDTFRAYHPLMTIIDPDLNQAFIRSLILKQREGGIFPMWELAGNYTGTMIGYHAASIIADAYTKGYRDFDVQDAYKACIRAAEYDTTGILCPPLVLPHLMPQAKYWKNKIGYVPCDKDNESVAKALEYAYDDWCISLLAEALGDGPNREKYAAFAKGYQVYFDASTRFMRGLDSEGNWRTPFNPRSSNHRNDDYCEGTAWQWTWFVPHDVDGLVDLMGGREAFIGKLDSLFIAPSAMEGESVSVDISGLIGQYAHGNEPSHHIAHLYNYVGQPWRTQELVDEVLHTLYFNDPNGLSGNEDCGQMSAWFVLNSMGFYQVCPGKPVYSIGRPLFDKATIHLKGGKTFTIVTHNNSRENKYVQKMVLNGKELNAPFFAHQDMIDGGTLELTMGGEPLK